MNDFRILSSSFKQVHPFSLPFIRAVLNGAECLQNVSLKKLTSFVSQNYKHKKTEKSADIHIFLILTFLFLFLFLFDQPVSITTKLLLRSF